MFYHFVTPFCCNGGQQLLQPTQIIPSDARCLAQSHCTAYGRIEHPLRNLRHPWMALFLQRASKNGPVIPHHRLPDDHRLAIPRVPTVADFPGFGNMGFRLPSCTTWCDYTRPSATSPRPTSSWAWSR
jgi:hypothetical protein